jgi:flavodoxin
MKAIVIYDSQYGNTEQVAKAIGTALGADAKLVKVGDVKPADIAPYQYILVGSPTQGGKYTMAMKSFLDSLSSEVLIEKRLAAFDTRLKNVMVKMFGYAAPKIETALKSKGGNSVAQPAGFFVKSAKGPLLDGELEKAALWAKSVIAGVPTAQMPGERPVKQKE